MPLLDKENRRKLIQAYRKVWDYSDSCLPPEECGNYCCREHFNAYYIEFANIFDRLAGKFGEEGAREIFRRETGPVTSPLKTIARSKDGNISKGGNNYCRLLGEEGCLVYEDRPFTCRTHKHNGVRQGFLVCGHDRDGYASEENKKIHRRIKRLNDALDIPQDWKESFGFGGESLVYWFGKVFGESET